MLKSKPNQEVEIKLRVPDARALCRQLKQLGAREIIPRTRESNTLYDTPSRDLTRHGRLIRIRIEQPSSRGRKKRPGQIRSAVLTFKRPSSALRAPQTSRSKRSGGTRFKVRDELEVAFEGVEQMSVILRSLGLGPIFRYEKFRT